MSTDEYHARQRANAAENHIREAEAKAPHEHEWSDRTRYGWPYCRICGMVQRADGNNKPCRGPVKVTVRDGALEGDTK